MGFNTCRYKVIGGVVMKDVFMGETERYLKILKNT